MIELITTEKIPEWAICYFWNGELDGLTDGEIEVMQKWENEMYESAVQPFSGSEIAPVSTMRSMTVLMPSLISLVAPPLGSAMKWRCLIVENRPFLPVMCMMLIFTLIITDYGQTIISWSS